MGRTHTDNYIEIRRNITEDTNLSENPSLRKTVKKNCTLALLFFFFCTPPLAYEYDYEFVLKETLYFRLQFQKKYAEPQKEENLFYFWSSAYNLHVA